MKRALLTWLPLAAILAAAPASAATHQPKATATPVKHVVVLFLENNSFDHLLGYWCNQVADGTIARANGCPDGGMPTGPVTLSGGEQVPITVPGDVNPAVEHNVPAQQAAIDGGAMDGWDQIAGPQGACNATTGWPCMTGYTPSQLPNISSLATQFAISDSTFTLADSPSWAGHLALAAATQDGFEGNNPHLPPGAPANSGMGWSGCGGPDVTPWGPQSQLVPACVPDPALTGLDPVAYPYGGTSGPTPVPYVPTIMDRLSASGITWRIYGATRPGAAGYGTWNICPAFAECRFTQASHMQPDSGFFSNAASGTLPAFSVVTPGGNDISNACHNGMSITACDNWVGQVGAAVMNSPQWSSTALFITWDDCGCFYDQVPPPLAPDGTQDGPRVPLLIVSPYAKPGYTDTTPTTFDGILAYAEQNWGLAPLSLNDSQAYPFSNAFDYTQAPAPPVRMTTRPLPPASRHLNLSSAENQDT